MVLSVAGNTDTLTLKTADVDANNGPILKLSRDNNHGTDGDECGTIVFQAEDAADNLTNYVRMIQFVDNRTDGGEDGQLKILSLVDGTERNRIDIDGEEIVINEDSVDVDFRVETNDNANAFVIDGGNNNVGIGKAPASAVALTVKPASVNPSLTVQNTADGSRLAGSVWIAAQDRSSEGTQGSFAVLLHATSSNNSEIRIDLTTDSFRGGVVGTFWVTFGLGGANTMGAGWLSITKGADDTFAIFWDQQISQGGSPAITLTTTTASTTVLDAHLRIENTTHTYATYCVTKMSGGGGNGGDTPLFTLAAL